MTELSNEATNEVVEVESAAETVATGACEAGEPQNAQVNDAQSADGAAAPTKPRSRACSIALVSAFFAILVALLLAASYIVSPKDNVQDGSRLSAVAAVLAEAPNTLDVIALGDSLCYTSLSPLRLWNTHGFTSYMCSSNEQNASESLHYINQVFETQHPTVVMFEVHCLYQDNTINEYLYNKVRGVFPVFEYHDRWKKLTVEDFTQKIDHRWTDDAKGFNNHDVSKEVVNLDWMADTNNVDMPSRVNRFTLWELKQTCEAHGATLLLYSSPSPKCWDMAKHNAIVELAQDLELTYIDLNLQVDELNINWKTDSQDGGDHLNFKGAAKTTDYLGALLDEMYDLPDHRGDANYDSWNSAYQRAKSKNLIH